MIAAAGFVVWHGSGAEQRVAFGDNEGRPIWTLCWVCQTEKTATELGLCPFCERYLVRRK